MLIHEPWHRCKISDVLWPALCRTAEDYTVPMALSNLSIHRPAGLRYQSTPWVLSTKGQTGCSAWILNLPDITSLSFAGLATSLLSCHRATQCRIDSPVFSLTCCFLELDKIYCSALLPCILPFEDPDVARVWKESTIPVLGQNKREMVLPTVRKRACKKRDASE